MPSQNTEIADTHHEILANLYTGCKCIPSDYITRQIVATLNKYNVKSSLKKRLSADLTNSSFRKSISFMVNIILHNYQHLVRQLN